MNILFDLIFPHQNLTVTWIYHHTCVLVAYIYTCKLSHQYSDNSLLPVQYQAIIFTYKFIHNWNFE